jgi:hypothetical protein
MPYKYKYMRRGSVAPYNLILGTKWNMKIRGKCSRGGLRSHFENRSEETLCRKKERLG